MQSDPMTYCMKTTPMYARRHTIFCTSENGLKHNIVKRISMENLNVKDFILEKKIPIILSKNIDHISFQAAMPYRNVSSKQGAMSKNRIVLALI